MHRLRRLKKWLGQLANNADSGMLNVTSRYRFLSVG